MEYVLKIIKNYKHHGLGVIYIFFDLNRYFDNFENLKAESVNAFTPFSFFQSLGSENLTKY